MPSSVNALGSYALAVQNMQLSLIKANIDMQKQAVDILLNSGSDRTVAPSETMGTLIDIEVQRKNKAITERKLKTQAKINLAKEAKTFQPIRR